MIWITWMPSNKQKSPGCIIEALDRAEPAKFRSLCETFKWGLILKENLKCLTNMIYMF
jgi:hypothetical protein